MIIRVKEKVFNVGVTNEENIYIVKLSNLGQQGLSAYQIAVLNGFEGTEQEWLDSLQATGAETFLQLTDTPSTYTGQAGKFPKVNEAEDGLEFGDVPTIQELLEENAAQNNSIAVIQMSNDNLQTVVYSQNDNAVGISSSEVSAYSSFGGASINEQELLITDNNFETRYTLEGINKGDGFDFKEIEIGAGSGKFTIPDLEGEEETAATREWVQANVSGGAVESVNGQTGVVVLDASDVGAEPALGFTPENVANKTTDINGVAGTYPDTPTVKGYVDIFAKYSEVKKSISTVTGTTSNTIIDHLEIPGNRLKNNSEFMLRSFLRKNTTASNEYFYFVNSSLSLTGATQIGRFLSAAANRYMPFTRIIYRDGGNLFLSPAGSTNLLTNTSLISVETTDQSVVLDFTQPIFIMVVCANADTNSESSLLRISLHEL